MNERIKKLAEQAGYLPDSFGIGHWDMPECQKFAELIVRECAKLADKESSYPYSSYGLLIREQFGVKE